MAEHDPALCVREARVHYFQTSGFPQDVGYAERWLEAAPGSDPVLDSQHERAAPDRTSLRYPSPAHRL